PAISESRKKSQIQFHSRPAKYMSREGYATSIACTGLAEGKGGSAEKSRRSHKRPCRRIGDSRSSPVEMTTRLETIFPARSTPTSYLAVLLATRRQITCLSTGTCTAGALRLNSDGNCKERVSKPSLLAV